MKDLKRFVGRELYLDTFKSITNCTLGHRRRNVVCITGKSSFGKSSLKDKFLSFEIRSNLNCYFSFLGKSFSKVEFYQSLHERFDRDFSIATKERPANSRSSKSIEVQSIYPVKIAVNTTDLRSKKLEELLTFISHLCKTAGNPFSSITFIFDDVSATTCSAAMCNDIIMDLSAELDNTEDVPTINIVVLGLPGWKDSFMGHGLERRMTMNELQLKSLDINEVKNYLDIICRDTQWEYDSNGFLNCLYGMSGGMPYLLNQIGIEACKICQSESQPRKLLAKHVMKAVTTSKVLERAITVVKRDILKDSLDQASNEAEFLILGGFYYCCEFVELDWEKNLPDICEGFTKDEWKSKVLNLCSDDEETHTAFENVWHRLINNGCLVQNDCYTGRYTFCSEIIRYELKKFCEYR